MLISHEYRFIFISTHKTASTSTTIALSRFCGPMDVIPELDQEAEAIRREMGIFPNCYLAEPAEYTAKDIVSAVMKSGRKRLKRRFRPHMPACEVKPLVGEGIWNSYFKFSFDRNPWDRQVSHYFFNTRKRRERPEFDNWLLTDRRARLGNFEQYAIDDEIAIDFLGRYENLEEDISRVLNEVGIKEKVCLPRAKCQYRKSRKNYQAFYTDETRELIRNWYENEISTLDYTF